jgi:serine/threonine protein kinase
VVHRDLKPQNMLLTADDQVKIADFGAAVLTGGGAKVLAAGGTPAFMAPELFQFGLKEDGRRLTMSPQVDVWSLGATLYNMLFGRPPWMAKNQIELAKQIQNIELSFPHDCEGVDPHLRNLLKRMLEKDPKTRISMVRAHCIYH